MGDSLGHMQTGPPPHPYPHCQALETQGSRGCLTEELHSASSRPLYKAGTAPRPCPGRRAP